MKTKAAATFEGLLYTLVLLHQVMQSLKFALQPAVTDVSLIWDLPKGVSATVLSPPITSIFQGQRSLVYAQLTGLVRYICWFRILFFHMCICMCTNVMSNCVEVPQGSGAAEGHVTFKYCLGPQTYQDKLHFCLTAAHDNRYCNHLQIILQTYCMDGETVLLALCQKKVKQ